MAKQSSTHATAETLTVDQLREKAASVHTFDSFGRALVAAALTQAAESTGMVAQSPIAATVTITPINASGILEGGTAGGAATGKVTPSLIILICIGSSCHELIL